MQASTSIVDKSITYKLDSSLFSKESVFKCLYWYTNQFIIDVSHNKDLGEFQVKLELKHTDLNIDLNKVALKLNQDFIDYNLRDIVTKETSNIRDLIVAKAFSNGEFDENPPGELNDPIGYRFNEFL